MRQIPTAAASISHSADMIPKHRDQPLGLSFYHVLVWLLLSTTTWSTSRAFNPLIGHFQDYRSLPSKANEFSLYLAKNWEPSSLWWGSKRSKGLDVPITSHPVASDDLLDILKRLAVGNDGRISSTESKFGHLLTFDQSDEKDDGHLLNIDAPEQDDSAALVKLRRAETIRKNLRRRHKIGVSGKERRQLAKGRDFLKKLVNLREQWKKRPAHEPRLSKKLTSHRQPSPLRLPGATFGTQNTDSEVFSDLLFGSGQFTEPLTSAGFVGAQRHVTDADPIMGEGFVGEEDRVDDQDLVIFPRRDELPEDYSRGQYLPMPQRLFDRESSQFEGASWNDEHVSSGFFPETARTQRNDTVSSSFAAFSDFGPDLWRNPSSSDVTFSDGEFDSNNHDCETIATKSCSSDEACSCNGMYRCVMGRCALRSTQLPSYTPPGIWGEAIPFD